MHSYAIVPVVALFCYLFLGVSFLKVKKNGMLTSFTSLLALMILWTAGSLLMRLECWPSVCFWFHVSLTGLLLFPVAFFWFLRRFMNVANTYHMPAISSLLVILLLINYRWEIFIKEPARVAIPGGFAYVYDDVAWWVLFLFAAEVAPLFASIRMVYQNQKQSRLIKKQLQPIWIGIAIMAAGNTLLFFPIFRGFPIDVCSGIPMAIFLYYALYKKRLFPLDVLISRANCFIMAFLFTMLLSYHWLTQYGSLMRKTLGLDEARFSLVVFSVLTVFTLLLYGLISFCMDTVFEKNSLIQSKSIGRFSEKVLHLMKMDEILAELAYVIKKGTTAEKVLVYLINEEGDYNLVRGSVNGGEKDERISGNDPLLSILRKNADSLLVRDYKEIVGGQGLEKQSLQALGEKQVELISVLKDEDNYLGLLMLTEKQQREKYSVEDIHFLISVSAVASVAVKNSKLYESAYWEARRDYLTGAANRKYFYEVLEAHGSNKIYDIGSIAIVDVDDFKLYNQLYGEEEGDRALKQIAAIAQEELPKECLVARYSAGVFALALPGFSAEKARELSERISEKIRVINYDSELYGMKILTVSCGIAEGRPGISDYHELLDQAEMALYYAKQAGKNRIVVYTGGEGGKLQNPSVGTSRHTGLSSAYASTVYALMAAIDTKDHYTFHHSEAVACYARELAKAYGMNDEGCNMVYEAGLLHDVGKIGIEENILNKPQKLTEEEYEIMKTHVQLSIGIIRHLPSLEYVIPAVIGHHERYDGKGYPRRIQGEEIPLMARMLCIADSFDAMVSKRCYKKEMEVGRALQIIQEEAGKQFDPNLAPLFVALISQGIIPVLREGKMVQDIWKDE